MTILKIEPGKSPRTEEIKGDLKSMQNVVGGYIQAIYPFEEPIALICNEEGKLLNLPFNRALTMEGQVYDIVCGTFFLCSAPSDSDLFESLSDEQVKTYTEHFKSPEMILQAENGFVILKVSEEI